MLDLGPDEIQILCKRLKTSRIRLEVTTLIATRIATWSHLENLSPTARVELIVQADGIRKAIRFSRFNLACDEITGLGLSQDWQKIRDTMSAVKADDLNVKATGPELGELVRQEQIRRIGELG